MPEHPFSYAIWRVVPRVERGERINAGVVLFSRQHGFLDARAWLDEARLRALAPDADVDAIRAQLDAMVAIARGEEGAGAIARMDASDRFGWLTAPASTVVQPSEVHTGLCDDPEAMLERLFAELVAATAT